MSLQITCPKCRAPLLEGVFNQPALAPCPACGTRLQLEVFPAFFRKLSPGEAAQPVMVEGEASCFFHPQKKATVPCAGCGRFLCALCDCEFDNQHFCPACLEAGKSKGKIKALDNQRTRYDNVALSLALAPMLIFYFTLITAPMTWFVTIRYWNAPRGLFQRSRSRFIIAAIIAGLQIAAWVIFFIMLGTHHS